MSETLSASSSRNAVASETFDDVADSNRVAAVWSYQVDAVVLHLGLQPAPALASFDVALPGRPWQCLQHSLVAVAIRYASFPSLDLFAMHQRASAIHEIQTPASLVPWQRTAQAMLVAAHPANPQFLLRVCVLTQVVPLVLLRARRDMPLLGSPQVVSPHAARFRDLRAV